MQLLGYSREELLGMTPLDLKPDFDEPRYRALIAPLLDSSLTNPDLRWNQLEPIWRKIRRRLVVGKRVSDSVKNLAEMCDGDGLARGCRGGGVRP